MLVARKRIYKVVRQGINQQKRRQQPAIAILPPKSQDQTRESKQRRQKKLRMALDSKIVAGNYRRLRRRCPEIPDTLGGKPQHLFRTLAHELLQFALLLVHKTNFAQFLKSLHRSRVVSGVLVACPQAGRRIVVRLIQFERQIVANKNEPSERFVVPDRPRNQAKHKYA